METFFRPNQLIALLTELSLYSTLECTRDSLKGLLSALPSLAFAHPGAHPPSLWLAVAALLLNQLSGSSVGNGLESGRGELSSRGILFGYLGSFDIVFRKPPT